MMCCIYYHAFWSFLSRPCQFFWNTKDVNLEDILVRVLNKTYCGFLTTFNSKNY